MSCGCKGPCGCNNKKPRLGPTGPQGPVGPIGPQGPVGTAQITTDNGFDFACILEGTGAPFATDLGNDAVAPESTEAELGTAAPFPAYPMTSATAVDKISVALSANEDVFAEDDQPIVFELLRNGIPLGTPLAVPLLSLDGLVVAAGTRRVLSVDFAAVAAFAVDDVLTLRSRGNLEAESTLYVSARVRQVTIVTSDGAVACGVAQSSTTENPAFVDLIALPIVLAENMNLLIEASFSVVAFVRPANLRLAVDGVAVPESASEIPESPSLALGRFFGGAIIRCVPLTVGPHTVSLQWRAGAPGGVALVASNPDRSHASLVVHPLA